MTRNIIHRYRPDLRVRARYLRNNSTLEEVLIWKQIKGRTMGAEFHRQVPISSYIVDFYCHELLLAIEVDGSSHDNKQDYDIQRQSTLEMKGIRVVRYKNEDVRNNIIGVINDLQREIEKRKKELGITNLERKKKTEKGVSN